MCHARAIRERKRERESIQQEIHFFSKSFDNIFLNYISTLKYCYSFTNSIFLQILILHYYRNENTNIKKLTKKQLHKIKRNNTNND